MAIYEGRWDCPTCGTRGNRGPETKCPNCGAPRPVDVRFYLPSDAELIEDEKRKREALAGVDWICGHCSNQNKAIATICTACGNPRDETSQDVNLEERTYGNHEVPQDSFAPKRTQHPLEQQQAVPRRRGGMGRKIMIGAIVILGGIFLLRSVPKSIEVSVSKFQWERTLQMLRHEAVQKEAWNRPSGAFDVESFRAIRSYQQVFRGYETRTRNVRVKVGEEQYVCGKIDKGNGYFADKYCTRPIYENRQEEYQEKVYDQVPVYDTKYRFKIMEWVAHDRNRLKESGQTQKAIWPTPQNKGDPKNWKEGTRTESYWIIVRESDGDEHREKVGKNFWEGLNQGQKLKAKKSYIFDVYYGLDEPNKSR
ncbi:MAG: Ran-binding zinc finger domain-containing protein [Bacteroidota bacterium]